MGICLSKKSKRSTARIYNKRIANQTSSSNRWSRIRSSSVQSDDAVINEHAIAAAILFQQQNGGLLPFSRSMSVCNQRQQIMSRNSSTTRRRSVKDPLLLPPQMIVQECAKLGKPRINYSRKHVLTAVRSKQLLIVAKEVNPDELETSHIVLVHGGGFGAWCWFKTIALLQECKFKVTAIDLCGSGIDRFDPNAIKSLSQYAKPLTDFLEMLPDGEKVILAGHDIGGACMSYAMELFPNKVAKAIFIAASMLKTGKSTLDMFSHKDNTNDLMRQAQKFLYVNGNNQPPTAIDLDKSLLKDLLFNQSSTKDVVLASISMRPIPFSPILDKLSLSDSNYGSVRRFYIETPEDNAIPITLQQIIINESPPEKVFRLKGADHCPFFSKPQALHKLLVEIAKIK
ncbi:putative methylesterase 11, chloroplastic [Tanacetum coccineum]